MTIALLLPITYSLEPTGALIMLAGIFYGGMYGGSTTSILLNTPGESSSVVTAIEGNLMAKAGKAAPALATAAIGSFVAGTIGTTLIVFFAPLMASFAVSLGAPEYLAIMLLAFVAVTAVLGASRLRGFIALVVGLTIGLVGIDAVSGQARLTFGVAQLGDGIDVVVVAVGIFALGEALWVAAHLRRKATEIIPVGQPFLRKEDWKRSWKPWLRGTAFGFPFGVIPAGGAEIPTFLSYITEKKLSKHPEEFGGSDRRGRRSGGGQQRQRRRHHGADALSRSAHQRHVGDHARRPGLLRHPAGSAAAAAGERPGLGADRQPVHRQLAAAAC